MKISVEEVSRLMASPRSERPNAGSHVALTPEAFGLDFPDQAVVTMAPPSPPAEVERVKQIVNRLPEVRADRIRAIKAQIENGSYRVSGDDIADLMLRRALADNTQV